VLIYFDPGFEAPRRAAFLFQSVAWGLPFPGADRISVPGGRFVPAGPFPGHDGVLETDGRSGRWSLKMSLRKLHLSGESLSAKKNALSGYAQDAFGSPPPELPNYMVILCPFGRAVNVTFVM